MLNEQGFSRPSYDDLVAEMSEQSRKDLGEDIDVSETSVYGKFIRIIAKALAKGHETLENTYYSRFPNTSSGVSLDRLAVFAGITRNPATYARHKITVQGTADTAIGMGGLLVGDKDNITFYNENDFVIGADGTASVIVAATEAGANGNVDNIDIIVNPVTGITSISYVGLEEAGEDTESDQDLRKRFSLAIAGAGSCTVDSIRGSVARLSDVESVSVVVNDSSETDTEGRPANSFELYVYGGEGLEQEIAEAIFEKKPIGIKAVSTADEEHAVTKSVKDLGGFSHEISFSKVTEVFLDISITIKTSTAYTENGATAIKNNIVEYVDSLGVGSSVVTSKMYATIFSVAGVTEVVSVTQARTGEAQSTETLNFDFSEIPKTRVENITVTVLSV